MGFAKGEEAKPPKDKGGSSGGKDWSGGGTGDGSSDAKLMKRYMQSYLQVIYKLYGNRSFSARQQQLANAAFRMKWPASIYAEMLRREDPMYVRSSYYKDRVDEARELYQTFRPGRVPPAEFLSRYAHSQMSRAQLQERIEKSKWFKREFAGWTAAQRAGSPAGYSPQTFINYRTLWNNALQRMWGRPATKAEQRLMFSSGMTGDEVANNLYELMGGQEALRWATGGTMTPQELLRSALTAKFGPQGIGSVRQARGTGARFLASQLRPFDITTNQNDEIVQSRL